MLAYKTKTTSELAKELKTNTTAVRVSFSWLGTHKTLTAQHRAQAAETFGADAKYLSASQKLFDTRHPAFKKLTAIKNEVIAYWKVSTLPYTEDGIRLLHKNRVEAFNQKMQEYQDAFNEAVNFLEECLGELKQEASLRLGTLYNPDHYPDSIKPFFKVEWDFPSIEPPEYLAQLSPKIYKQQQELIQDRLKEAITLAEGAFLNEFKTLVDSLCDRLTPNTDGTKKVFRDSTVTNLMEFFQKFKDLHMGGNYELEELIQKAQAITQGLEPQDLRNSELLKVQIANEMKTVADKLTPLVINMPRRRIIKPNEKTQTVPA